MNYRCVRCAEAPSVSGRLNAHLCAGRPLNHLASFHLAKSSSVLHAHQFERALDEQRRYATHHLLCQSQPCARDLVRPSHRLCGQRRAPHGMTIRAPSLFRGQRGLPYWRSLFVVLDPSTRTRAGSFRSCAPRLSGRSKPNVQRATRQVTVSHPAQYDLMTTTSASPKCDSKRVGTRSDTTLRASIGPSSRNARTTHAPILPRCRF